MSLGTQQRDDSLRRGASKAFWASARLRFSDALRGFFFGLPALLVTLLLSLATVKVLRVPADMIGPFAVPTIIVAVLLLAWSAYQLLRRRPLMQGALVLDRYYKLGDRLSSALSFSKIPREKRTPFMELAMDQGAAVVDKLRIRPAAPIAFPPMVHLSAVLIAVIALVAVFEIRDHKLVAHAKTIEPATMDADDIDYFRKSLEQMRKRTGDESVRMAVDKFNQLVEDLANKRLERTEAFRRMAALDRDLREGQAADKKALEEGLERVAKQLNKSQLSRPLANALENKKLDEAEKKLRALAKQLRNKPKKVRKAELERLRKALREASRQQAEHLKALQRRRKQLQKQIESLLKKKRNNKGGLTKRQERLLRKKRRQLARLNRRMQADKAAGRRLSRLDRQLAQAAADLARDLGLSAKDLEHGAEELNRLAREQMSEKEKQELRRKIQEMRELLRQQGRGGKVRLVRLRRFSRAARGRRGRPGRRGKGGQGKGQGQGKGKPGEVWVVGPGGRKILVFKAGSSSGAQPGSGQPGGHGKQAGVGHDGNIKGKATHSKMKTRDVTAEGIDSHQGPTRAQVIYGAADKGFVGGSYQKVFTEYHTVAERAMQREDVPAGYRFYVRRYFQLIRPREP